MVERIIEIDGSRWRVRALDLEVARQDADAWHYARVRFDPLDDPPSVPRETWLRMEEDVPAGDVLDQYADAELLEAYLIAEEVVEG